MKGVTAGEERDLVLSVGTHRKGRRLSPLEVGKLLRKALDHGATRQECAARLQIGTTQVGVFLTLLELAPDIQPLADWGNTSQSTISFSSLAQLAGLKDHAEQVKAAHAVLAHRLHWKEVVQLVQLRNRSRRSIDECVGAVLQLRPDVETRHVFVGSVVSDPLKAALSSMLQSRKDKLLRHALDKIPGISGEFVGRLGVDRFTIVGEREPTLAAGATPDALEDAVNQALVEEVLGE